MDAECTLVDVRRNPVAKINKLFIVSLGYHNYNAHQIRCNWCWDHDSDGRWYAEATIRHVPHSVTDVDFIFTDEKDAFLFTLKFSGVVHTNHE